MPAKVTLFSAACKPVYDLGSGPYNLVRWNPFGRFFAIAGFGNLPGERGEAGNALWVVGARGSNARKGAGCGTGASTFSYFEILQAPSFSLTERP